MAYLRSRNRDSGTPAAISSSRNALCMSLGITSLAFQTGCSKDGSVIVKHQRKTRRARCQVTSRREMSEGDQRVTSKLGTGQTSLYWTAKYSRHCNRNNKGSDNKISTVDWLDGRGAKLLSGNESRQKLLQSVVENSYTVVTSQIQLRITGSGAILI